LLANLPGIALQSNFDNSETNSTSTPLSLDISGHHFFLDRTTPFFDLNTASMQLGQAACVKNATMAAPAGSFAGEDNESFGSVPWLQLLTKPGATGNLAQIYRLNTAGGSPPPDCGNSPATFEVQYAAE
jgi:hypothetical protein